MSTSHARDNGAKDSRPKVEGGRTLRVHRALCGRWFESWAFTAPAEAGCASCRAAHWRRMDAVSAREEAAAACMRCGKPIGYETRWYAGPVHALCEEQFWERLHAEDREFAADDNAGGAP